MTRGLEKSEQDRLDVIREGQSHFLRDLDRKQKEQRQLLNNAQSEELLADMEKRQQEALRALGTSER